MSLRDLNYANLFIDDLKESSITRNDFHIPHDFYDYSRNFMFNSSYNYYCKGFHDNFISFVFLNGGIDYFSNMNYVRLYDNGVVERYFINFDDLDISKKSEVYNYVSLYCNGYVYYDGSFHNTQSVQFNNNIYDDLKYSNEPSEIIISCLYIFIPILLFIIGLKVFKKGLFR